MRRIRVAGYALVLALAVATYVHDLSSPHIPKNGDEYPYTHITRLTAASGRLLPLVSDLPGLDPADPNPPIGLRRRERVVEDLVDERISRLYH